MVSEAICVALSFDEDGCLGRIAPGRTWRMGMVARYLVRPYYLKYLNGAHTQKYKKKNANNT
jgi:hypothetical protein